MKFKFCALYLILQFIVRVPSYAQLLNYKQEITHNNTPERAQFQQWLEQSKEVTLPNQTYADVVKFHKGNNQDIILGSKTVYLLRPLFNTAYSKEELISIANFYLARYKKENNNFPRFIVEKRLKELNKK